MAPTVIFLNELTSGKIFKAVVEPLSSNLAAQIPFNSVVPKVNAGCVNHVPLVVPADLGVALASKVIDMAWGSLEPFSAFQSKYLYLGIQTYICQISVWVTV